MSLPLERDDDPAHYRPCQRLADYIRDAGYNGIRYPSALNPDGTNVVFFDPTVGDIGDSKLVKITETQLKYEEEKPPSYLALFQNRESSSNQPGNGEPEARQQE